MKTITADSAMFSPDWDTIYVGEYSGKKSDNHFIRDVVIEIYDDVTYVFGCLDVYKYGKTYDVYKTEILKWSWEKFWFVPTGEYQENMVEVICWHIKRKSELYFQSDSLKIIRMHTS
jgi:hypothetical protein